MRGLGPLAADELRLEGERRTAWLDLHAPRAGLGTDEKRAEAIVELANATKALLDPSEQQKYHELTVRLVEQAVLAPP